jgi:hypothetical protein
LTTAPESRKRAVGEACSAAESTMQVVLKEHGNALPKPMVLTKLVDRLIAEGLVEGELREILEAAVAAAVVAIIYLARQLPARP